MDLISMKILSLTVLGIMIATLIFTSYAFIHPVTADVCLSCWLKQKAQDIQNNQNIPEPHRSEIANKVTEKINQLDNHIGGNLGCSGPWFDPNGC